MSGVAAVIVGAGRGTRLGGPLRKAWTLLGARPLWWHAARAFRAEGRTTELVLVVHEEDVASTESHPGSHWCSEVGVDRIVVGGADRQGSVLAGVRAVSETAGRVLVHDAARPFVAPERVGALIDALETHAAGLLAARTPSTVQRVDGEGRVVETLPREELRLAQTPQGADRATLLGLLERAAAEGASFTDEAGLLAWGGIPVHAIEDSPLNFKVTTPDDLILARALTPSEPVRIGHGYDIHRITEGGPLVLGGIEIPVAYRLDGHSDGDAVIHAVIEAFLGAAGLPDIGEFFPPGDPATAGIDSTVLLGRVLEELSGLGLGPLQVDVSVIAEKPRLRPYKQAMKERLQELLGLSADRVAVKARSGEKVGPVGRGEAIEVHCAASLQRVAPLAP